MKNVRFCKQFRLLEKILVLIKRFEKNSTRLALQGSGSQKKPEAGAPGKKNAPLPTKARRFSVMILGP